MTDYFTVDGAPLALFRRRWSEPVYPEFAYLDRGGRWVECDELLQKIKEPTVNQITEREAAKIAHRRGARLDERKEEVE